MTDVRKIRIEDYDYVLPEDRIAKYPLSRRDSSKLLVYRSGDICQNVFKNLAYELSADSFLVFNNTKVIQARLLFKKSTGAQVEVFCLEPFMPADYQLNFQSVGSCEWKCMIGNAKRWKEGCLFLETVIEGSDLVLRAERTGECKDNSFTVRFSWNLPVCFSQILEALGHLPIPPYLNREAEESDKRTYQTVYGKIDGSVAAPTAGSRSPSPARRRERRRWHWRGPWRCTGRPVWQASLSTATRPSPAGPKSAPIHFWDNRSAVRFQSAARMGFRTGSAILRNS